MSSLPSGLRSTALWAIASEVDFLCLIVFKPSEDRGRLRRGLPGALENKTRTLRMIPILKAPRRVYPQSRTEKTHESKGRFLYEPLVASHCFRRFFLLSPSFVIHGKVSFRHAVDDVSVALVDSAKT